MERPTQDYRRRLHDSLQLLDRNFKGLLSAAQVDLKSGSSAAADHDRGRLQIDLNTANIVKGGEQLLQLVDKLKLPIIANDFEHNNLLAAKREAVLASMTARVDMGVAQLSKELAQGITELETHYYSSTSR